MPVSCCGKCLRAAVGMTVFSAVRTAASGQRSETARLFRIPCRSRADRPPKNRSPRRESATAVLPLTGGVRLCRPLHECWKRLSASLYASGAIRFVTDRAWALFCFPATVCGYRFFVLCRVIAAGVVRSVAVLCRKMIASAIGPGRQPSHLTDNAISAESFPLLAEAN